MCVSYEGFLFARENCVAVSVTEFSYGLHYHGLSQSAPLSVQLYDIALYKITIRVMFLDP
jgi:hypothetical protein